MPTDERPIRCVVFDLGGVLVRICRSWPEACARAGVAYHEDLASPQQLAARRTLRDRYETGQIPCDEFFAAVAATTEGLISPWQFRRVHEAWLIGEYDRVRGVIDRLHAAGIATGVLSNTNANHWDALITGVAGCVHHPHASHLLGVAKPDLGIYRAFEQATGFAGPQILFFDDLEANVGGAGAAGWLAQRIDPDAQPADQMLATLDRLGVV